MQCGRHERQRQRRGSDVRGAVGRELGMGCGQGCLRRGKGRRWGSVAAGGEAEMREGAEWGRAGVREHAREERRVRRAEDVGIGWVGCVSARVRGGTGVGGDEDVRRVCVWDVAGWRGGAAGCRGGGCW